jgi:phenylalanyl-tRNA synthetase beta chain
MHAYDLAQLRGHIDVRQARRGERVKLLTGTEVSLDADTLVIADASGAIGIAGIMGGATTSVSQATRDVFLESAFFSPGAIAGRARRHGLQTDASIRFERGVDPSGQVRAVERATSLLLQIAGGAAGPCQHFVTRDRPPPAGIHLREKQIGRILGTTFPATEVEAVLRRLGMQVKPVGGGWTVTPPPHRFDVAIEADLLEEIARVTGYERIPEIAGLQAAVLGSCSESAISVERVSDALVDRGYQEVITYSFTEAGLDGMLAGEGPKAITLVNPISADLGTLRRTMWPGLVRTALHNQARQQARIRCFEKGVVYHASGKDVTERAVIAGMAVGAVVPEQWDVTAAPADFFDVKADIEAMLSMGGLNAATEFLADVHPALQPGRTARIRRDGADIGWLGNLHPALVARLDLVGAPVLFEIQLSAVQRAMAPAYAGLSRYPSVRRDLSLVMDRSVPASAILSSIARVAGPALRETIIFDVYAGGRLDAGKKSIALGLILQQTSRTLTDAETDQIIGTIIRTLAADLGAEIRA